MVNMINKKNAIQDLQDKIQILETKSAFQEDAVNQLNAVVIEQQQQLDHLHIVIDSLRGTIQTINPDAIRASLKEELPPHY